jgi:hypothetical protein
MLQSYDALDVLISVTTAQRSARRAGRTEGRCTGVMPPAVQGGARPSQKALRRNSLMDKTRWGHHSFCTDYPREKTGKRRLTGELIEAIVGRRRLRHKG